MFTRAAATGLLIFALCFVGIPSPSKSKKPNPTADKASTGATSQNPGLTISTTRTAWPDGTKVVWNLTGHYQNAAGHVVNLRASTVRPAKCQDCGINPGISPSTAEAMPSEDQYRPDSDYYYSNSEMMKSDGAILVETTYEYEQPANRNVLRLLLGGVTITLDMNAQTFDEISDSDYAQLQSWLSSDDGHLAEQTGVAIVQEGQQQYDNEALLTYYLSSYFMGSDSQTAKTVIPTVTKERTSALHHVSFNGSRKMSDLSNALLARSILAPAQCPGGCGPGCVLVFDRYGNSICGPPCFEHDECARLNGGRFARPCRGALARAIVYTAFRYFWGKTPNALC